MWIHTARTHGGYAGVRINEPASMGANQMEFFCLTQMEGRETGNRGRKALHAGLKETAERIPLKEGALEVGESPIAEKGQGVRPGRPGK